VRRSLVPLTQMSPLRCHSRHPRAQTRQLAEAGGGAAASRSRIWPKRCSGSCGISHLVFSFRQA